ncbi:MAG: hypothetical protein NZ927_01110 [Candidatus Calescibacterium sp.]|nr:hypothetical protein [Candidatus Calescibacterium sp.]
MKLLKIVYADKIGEQEILLASPVNINVPISKAIELGICSFDDLEKNLENFRIGEKLIKGILICRSEEVINEFIREHLVNKDDRIHRFRSPFVEFHIDPYYVNFVKIGKNVYACPRTELIIFYGWDIKGSNVQPVLCGRINKSHYNESSHVIFYYSGYNQKSEMVYIRLAKSPKELPNYIINALKLYGVSAYSSGSYSFATRNKYISQISFVHFLPFPPYEALYAVRAFSPKVVEDSEELDLPDFLNDVFVVKTFLFTSEPINILELRPGQLKRFASFLHGEVFDPSVRTENPQNEYISLFKNSCGYFLICKPKWPL